MEDRQENCRQAKIVEEMPPKTGTACQELSAPKSGSVDASSYADCRVHFPEHLITLRNLRILEVFHDGQLTDQDMCMNLHEYSATRLNSACPIKDPIAFLLKPAPELFLTPHIQAHVSKITGETIHPVKWLHMHKASKRIVMGLAVKYPLDPRFVFRVLSLGSAKAEQVSFCDVRYEETEKAVSDASSPNSSVSTSASSSFEYSPIPPNLLGTPSIDRPMWFFMAFPILRLSEQSKETLRMYQAWRESVKKGANRKVNETLDAMPCVEIVIEHCNLAMFVSGIDEGNTAISFSSDWAELIQFNTMPIRADQTCAKSYWCCRRRTNNILAESSSAGGPINENAIGGKHTGTRITSSDRVLDIAQLSMFDNVMAAIGVSNAVLRSGDAHTFVLKVLRDITYGYLLIAEAYKTCLLILQERIAKEKDILWSKEVSRITESIQQLSHLNEVVGPVANLAETISSRNQWSGNAVCYLSDIRSNVAIFLKDVSTTKMEAQAMLEKYKQFSQVMPRPSSDPITLVNTMFILGQFLKMVCGLKFHLYVVPLVPALTWEDVYLYFWCLFIWIPCVRFILKRQDGSKTH